MSGLAVCGWFIFAGLALNSEYPWWVQGSLIGGGVPVVAIFEDTIRQWRR